MEINERTIARAIEGATEKGREREGRGGHLQERKMWCVIKQEMDEEATSHIHTISSIQ